MPEITNIFDSHAHYNDERYDIDRKELLEQMHCHSVSAILNVGCTLEEAQKAVLLAEQYPYIYASVGIHPEESQTVPNDYLEQLTRLAASKKVVAVGEIGLDYHYDSTDKPSQKKIFQEQHPENV